MRELKGITDVPYMRPDGSVIVMPGWDEMTGLYYQPRAGLAVKVREKPTRAQGREALEMLAGLVGDFPFASKRDRMAAVGLMLTIAGRPAIEGPTPLFAFDGNGPGAGKNLLARACGYAGGLSICAPTTWPKTEEELEKRLASALLAGERYMLMDECARTLQSESVRVATTERFYQARRLGQSDVRALPSTMVIGVIGNNLNPGLDMPRRVCLIRLEAGIDPTARTGFRFPDLEAEAKRGVYLGAALTVLRSYVVAGRPAVELKNLGSYGAWGQLVRGAIVWLGATDPMLGLEAELREDSDVESTDQELLTVLHEWSKGKPFTARDVAKTDDLAIREALTDALPEPTSFLIGNLLRRLRGRRYRGLPVLHPCRTKNKRQWRTKATS
jgi:putative DNA primase/helicase